MRSSSCDTFENQPHTISLPPPCLTKPFVPEVFDVCQERSTFLWSSCFTVLAFKVRMLSNMSFGPPTERLFGVASLLRADRASHTSVGVWCEGSGSVFTCAILRLARPHSYLCSLKLLLNTPRSWRKQKQKAKLGKPLKTWQNNPQRSLTLPLEALLHPPPQSSCSSISSLWGARPAGRWWTRTSWPPTRWTPFPW